MHERVSGGGAIVSYEIVETFNRVLSGKPEGRLFVCWRGTLGIAFANGENGKTAKMEICE